MTARSGLRHAAGVAVLLATATSVATAQRRGGGRHGTATPVLPALPLAAADTGRVVEFRREVFDYDPAGRRDPFVSLMTSTELRPALGDLRLTTVAFDPTGVHSVAVLRDLGTKEQYRVRVGSQLGRMRVVRIDPKVVTFALEEFGYSRQESLALGDSTSTRTP